MIDKLKELFWKRNQIAGKTKDELIALLVEKISRESTKVEFSDSLMKMILQMQEQQFQMEKETRTWVSQQQEDRKS